jgi:N-acyl-D-aspartate/D-glutamate deacylase
MIAGRDIRLQWVGLPARWGNPKLQSLYDTHARYKAEGRDFTASFATMPPASTITFFSSLTFGQSGILVWHEIIAARTEEEKIALLESDEWRARARQSWDAGYPNTPLTRPHDLTLQESETGLGPVGVTLGSVIERTGQHVSDALADWLLVNGLGSSVMVKLPDVRSDTEIAALMADPQAICNITDAGAHGQMLCGIGNNVQLLTNMVRGGHASIELTVHNLTGKLAGFFGLADRGVVAVGKAADIVVFDLTEIEQRPLDKTYDVPDGKGGRTWRYTRAPAPMRMTMVNGTPTWINGRYTGAFPGAFVSPDVPQVMAEAAE